MIRANLNYVREYSYSLTDIRLFRAKQIRVE